MSDKFIHKADGWAAKLDELTAENARLRGELSAEKSMREIDKIAMERLKSELQQARKDGESFKALIQHMCVHDGCLQNGYLLMTTEQKELYCKTIGAAFTPAFPAFKVDAAMNAENGKCPHCQLNGQVNCPKHGTTKQK